MKLSIITVNLNNCDGLKRTIDSVVSQTFKDFEWIIIDGGSTDGSRELIEKNAKHFTYLCSESDKGIYNAMNKGVTQASGDFCQFLNSGDCFESRDVLSTIIPELSADVVYGDATLKYENGKIIVINYPDNLSLGFLVDKGICHQSAFIRSSLLKDIKYDESLKISSDWKFFIELAVAGNSFKHVPIQICEYVMGGISDVQYDRCMIERQAVWTNFPPTAHKEEITVRRKVQSHLANTELEDFCEMCDNHRFLAKLITAVVSILKRI